VGSPDRRVVGVVTLKYSAQVAMGGPVTAPRPDIIRYFMTLPEAAPLVLQAAAIGESGQVLTLALVNATAGYLCRHQVNCDNSQLRPSGTRFRATHDACAFCKLA
jgi:Polysaccharide biosynthesis protein